MTETNHPIAEQDSLEARLRSLRSEQVYINRDGTIRPDYRNPDGPEAADTLSQMRDALLDVRKLAMDDHWSPPNQCWAIASRIDAALATTKIEKE